MFRFSELLGACAAVGLLCFSLGAMLGDAVGGRRERGREQSRAVEAGAGRWAVDPTTGATRFEYVKGTR